MKVGELWGLWNWFLIDSSSLIASFIPFLCRWGSLKKQWRCCLHVVLQFHTEKCNYSRNCPRRQLKLWFSCWKRKNGYTITHTNIHIYIHTYLYPIPLHLPPPIKIVLAISKSKNNPGPDLWKKLPNPVYNWGDLRDREMFSFSLWEPLRDSII